MGNLPQPADVLRVLDSGLARYGLAAILWGSLFIVAWYRQRDHEASRERWLAPAFGAGFIASLLMVFLVYLQMLWVMQGQTVYPVTAPLQRALGLATFVIITGAFLRYALDEARRPRAYTLAGLTVTLVCLALALWQRPFTLTTLTEMRFRGTWPAWLFDIAYILLVLVALGLIRRQRTWLARGVFIALLLVLAGQVILLANNITARDFRAVAGPVGHGFGVLAMFTLAHVYARQQALDRRQTEQDLDQYRLRLEELVEERTAELTTVNQRLTEEVRERAQAEAVLAQLTNRYEMILESAGAGICGIDRAGHFTFINRTAAEMLGYEVEELIGQASHPVLHHSRPDHSAYPDEHCPIYEGYALGIASQGEDEYYWRKDNTLFPIQYISNPTYEGGKHTGTVLVFRDITARKQAEAEIARQTADLTTQNAVAATLSQSLDLDAILAASLDLLMPTVNMEAGLIFLTEEDTEALALRSFRAQFALAELRACAQAWSACHASARQAVQTGQTVTSGEAAADVAAENSGQDSPLLNTLISAPLVAKGRVIGALTLGSRQVKPVDAPDLALVTAVAQQIALAIENSRLYQTAEDAAALLSKLNQVSIILTSTLDLARLYQQIAEQSARLLDCQAAAILRWREPEREVELIAAYGLDEAERELLRAGPGVSERLQEMAACHPSMAINDTLADARVPEAWRTQLAVRALICVPIAALERSLGVLFVLDRQAQRAWRPDDLTLIESVVNVAAIALTNAHYHKQLEWAAALEERQRIAADMHDGLAQTITVLSWRIDEALDLASNGMAREALAGLSQIRATIDQVSTDVRRSIASLNAAPEPRRSLQEQLCDLLQRLPEQEGAAVEFTSTVEEPLFLAQTQRAEALMVVQEALLNALRHARADQIALRLECSAPGVCILVEDNGVGFDPLAWSVNSPDHFGLRIMQARAARIGARFSIDSAPGHGARVALELPLNCAEAGPPPDPMAGQAGQQAGVTT